MAIRDLPDAHGRAFLPRLRHAKRRPGVFLPASGDFLFRELNHTSYNYTFIFALRLLHRITPLSLTV